MLCLNKFKKTEVIFSVFSIHNGMKLKINYRKKTGKNTNRWIPNNTLLNNQWVNKKSKRQSKKYLEKRYFPRSVGWSKSSPKKDYLKIFFPFIIFLLLNEFYYIHSCTTIITTKFYSMSIPKTHYLPHLPTCLIGNWKFLKVCGSASVLQRSSFCPFF